MQTKNKMSKKRFNAKESTVTKQLISTMRKMDASNLKVNKDLMKGDVEIIFDRSGKRYVFRCNTYENSLDNYRASQLCIQYLYQAFEAYGVTKDTDLYNTVLDNFLLSWQATPDDTTLLLGDGNQPPHKILGIKPDSNRQEIKAAYKSLSKIHHPDLGGDQKDFIRLRKAYMEMIKND